MDLVALVRLILALGLVGFLVWLITTYIPMAEPIKRVIVVIVVVVVVLYLLSMVLGQGILR
jgi:hypothetical protein